MVTRRYEQFKVKCGNLENVDIMGFTSKSCNVFYCKVFQARVASASANTIDFASGIMGFSHFTKAIGGRLAILDRVRTIN